MRITAPPVFIADAGFWPILGAALAVPHNAGTNAIPIQDQNNEIHLAVGTEERDRIMTVAAVPAPGLKSCFAC